MKKILAFDASTNNLSVAIGELDSQTKLTILAASNQENCKSSAFILTSIRQLLEQLNLTLAQIDYIAFGQGPGSFTGIRTSCSVAQGLAFGINCQVIPVSTLLTLAQQAQFYLSAQATCSPINQFNITAALDARMNEIYYAEFNYSQEHSWQIGPINTISPTLFAPATNSFLVGNIFSEYAAVLPANIADLAQLSATPRATAMLQLTPYLLQQNHACAPEYALPVYVRNKVALTIAERQKLKRD